MAENASASAQAPGDVAAPVPTDAQKNAPASAPASAPAPAVDLAPRLRAEALDFLLHRRSTPAKTLTGPGPSAEALRTMLTAAARTPDHGKLTPWRFLIIEGAAQAALSKAASARGEARDFDAATIEKTGRAFLDGPLIVAVIASPKPSEKIPAAEQLLSAGAVCLALVNAALASGYGANWLTGWIAFDQAFCEEALGMAPYESVAGFIHIGTARTPPPERPRPDIDEIARTLAPTLGTTTRWSP